MVNNKRVETALDVLPGTFAGIGAALGGYMENDIMTKDNFTKSETFKNLIKAFEGESQAYTKYQFYASQAKKDGFVQIANIFDETAHNEKEHAKIWFKLLHDGVPTTTINLENAVEGETYEHDVMYAEFAQKAYDEGYNDIGDLFIKVSNIEQHHARRYQKLLDNIENDAVFNKTIASKWICSNCGHIYVDEEAPDICPVCSHPKAYFELLSENF